MPADILKEIVREKKKEVASLYEQYNIEQLEKEAQQSPKSFYQQIAEKATKKQPFIISEFKRKSPSEGWINQHTAVEQQASVYVEKGASAMSVLTDNPYFGGTYEDLATAATALDNTSVLLLQKDFIIDPIQIFLARKHGANLILLIAAILDIDKMRELKELAEGLGMGVLAEVHSLQEYTKIESLNFTVVGVNNRDLSTFKTALNCCNYIAQNISHDKYLIAESGMGSALDLSIAGQHAHGFLIGTSLMRSHASVPFDALTEQRYFFKACGIRTQEDLRFFGAEPFPDLIGVNFSPLSKRRGKEEWLNNENIPNNAVAVFKGNTEKEIEEILETYPFKYIQLYSSDISVDFVKKIKQKIILAVAVREQKDWQDALLYAPYIDHYIMDGATPGSGAEIAEGNIPEDFPYPFLLAGGMNEHNLDRMTQYKNCIGVDMASGIEVNGKVDRATVQKIADKVQNLKLTAFTPEQ